MLDNGTSEGTTPPDGGRGRRTGGLILAATIVVLLAASARTLAGTNAWWRDPDIQLALHLTPRQVAQIEGVFDLDLPLRSAHRRTLADLEDAFAGAMRDGDVDRIARTHLVDRIEALRARINVRRTMMLIAMYRVLSPDQRQALPAVVARASAMRP